MERGDHVTVAVPNQRGENLSVTGKISEMADGFSKQGVTTFALDDVSRPGALLSPYLAFPCQFG